MEPPQISTTPPKNSSIGFPPAYVPPPSSKSKILNLVLILLLITMVAIMIGGYFYIKSKMDSVSMIKVKPTPTIMTKQLTPTPKVDETTTWETYSHKDYHYSIKFPPQYQLYDRFYPQINIQIKDNGQTSIPSLGDLSIGLWQPERKCRTDSECFTILETSYKGAKSAGSKTEYSSIDAEISGRSIKGFEIWDSGSVKNGTVTSSSLIYEFPMSLNGKFFELKFQIYKYSTKSEAVSQKILVDKILSTFTFLDNKLTESLSPSPNTQPFYSPDLDATFTLPNGWSAVTSITRDPLAPEGSKTACSISTKGFYNNPALCKDESDTFGIGINMTSKTSQWPNYDMDIMGPSSGFGGECGSGLKEIATRQLTINGHPYTVKTFADKTKSCYQIPLIKESGSKSKWKQFAVLLKSSDKVALDKMLDILLSAKFN